MKRLYIFKNDSQSALLWLMSHVYKPLTDKNGHTVTYNYGNALEYCHDDETDLISFDEFMKLFADSTLEYLPED